MKTRIKQTLAIILGSTFLLSGCYKLEPLHGIKGQGPMYQETRNVNEFNGLQVNVDARVNVTIGSMTSVEILGQSNNLDILDVRTVNGVLVIEYNESVWHHKRLQIDITVPELSLIASFGSGEIIVHNPLATDELHLDIFGSGSIGIQQLSTMFVNSRIKGSGEIMLDGFASVQHVNISGSGNYNANDLLSEEAGLTIFGSGNCNVMVTELLEVSIHGSGNVYYKGDPMKSRFSVFGSGKIVQVQ
jgi:hypothetical protein